MRLLEEKIKKDGEIIGGSVLKVDSFLNHQLDINLFNEMGKEFKRLFEKENITKIFTIETSGIAIASLAALHFDVPVLFAKKHAGSNMDEDCYEANVYSYTKNKVYTIKASKRYLSSDDRVLIIDDFLASGSAVKGMIQIVRDAGAYVAGVGIAIEKGFESGRAAVEELGVRVESLAIIDSMEDNRVIFK
jgi:xanthine phosphoribosyltransferase